MPKNRDLPALSEAQLEIMNVIWDHGECSVAAVWKMLQERRRVSRNTVHTLIARLEEKGWLSHREADSAFLYRASVSRERTQQRTVERMVQTVFNGSAEGLVLALLGGGRLTKAEAARIRQLIASAKARKT
ncbi:MAG: BlaI/MecI/CopY family transcriptional regulator [Planctomycetia bacterium]|nr:BlaI/MecI/CopY family transcriptional regulator [Planctomycetia bacterium]